MRVSHTILWSVALSGIWPVCQAQTLAAPPAPNITLSTRFATPLSYETALTRLGGYYQEQVGRILPLTLPEIGPMRHFEVWHDMFLFFELGLKGMNVTVIRPTESLGNRLVKTWMQEVAGRLEAELPLEFKEEPALFKMEADLFASRRDMARAFKSDATMKAIPTWEHAGLMVSAAPLAWVVLAPSRNHGVHRVKIEAGNPADARQLLAKLTQEIQKPGIYAVYSEEAELDQEIRELAGGQSAEVAATTPGAYIPNPDQKYLEGKVRAEPEMAKRTAAAQDQFAVRCRLEKAYRKLTLDWSELTGYARISGRYEAERAVAQTALLAPKPSLPSAPPVTLRARLSLLQPGAYRVRLEAEDVDGRTVRIDERSYWFDGKVFEEL
ncbi:MAG: hypothetical protein ABI806_29095 [Candidatus Solibacter sp.]